MGGDEVSGRRPLKSTDHLQPHLIGGSQSDMGRESPVMLVFNGARWESSLSPIEIGSVRTSLQRQPAGLKDNPSI